MFHLPLCKYHISHDQSISLITPVFFNFSSYNLIILFTRSASSIIYIIAYYFTFAFLFLQCYCSLSRFLHSSFHVCISHLSVSYRNYVHADIKDCDMIIADPIINFEEQF